MSSQFSSALLYGTTEKKKQTFIISINFLILRNQLMIKCFPPTVQTILFLVLDNKATV